MRMKSLVLAGLGAAGIALAATSVQAAPAGGLLAAVDRSAERVSPVENVTWYGRRHCHWHYGERHCWYGPRYRWHGYYYPRWRGYGYYDYPYRYHYGYRHGWY